MWTCLTLLNRTFKNIVFKVSQAKVEQRKKREVSCWVFGEYFCLIIMLPLERGGSDHVLWSSLLVCGSWEIVQSVLCLHFENYPIKKNFMTCLVTLILSLDRELLKAHTWTQVWDFEQAHSEGGNWSSKAIAIAQQVVSLPCMLLIQVYFPASYLVSGLRIIPVCRARSNPWALLSVAPKQ